MPRVAIKKKEYKASDLTKYLLAAMYEKGISQREVGELLNVTQQNISYRFKQSTWTYKELLTLFDYLQIPDEDILKIMKL